MDINQQIKVLEGHIKKVESELSTTKGQLKKLKEMVENKDDNLVGKRVEIVHNNNSENYDIFIKGKGRVLKQSDCNNYVYVFFDNGILREISQDYNLWWNVENEIKIIEED